MQKILSTLISFHLALIFSYAQVITVSDELSLKTEYVYDLLGRIGENILVIRDGINEFDIQAYNDDMSMTWQVEERLDNRKAKIIDVVTHDNAFNVIIRLIIEIHYLLSAVNMIPKSRSSAKTRFGS